MARIYATRDGDSLQIGGYGVASRLQVKDPKTGKLEWVNTPAIVPEEVAARFEGEIKGEVESEIDDPEKPGKRKTVKEKVPGGGRKDIRVERDGPAFKAHPKGKD